jgi:type II secretory pathway component PulJ
MPKRNLAAGFTLFELVIYTAILGVVGVVGVSILSQVSRVYLQNQSRTEVVQNLREATQIIQQAIQQASGINTATSTTLSLSMQDSSKDPTQFRLNADAIERKEGSGNWARITTQRVKVMELQFSIVSTAVSFIDQTNRWAWNGNGLGWIDFNPPDGNVRVLSGGGDFYGYAKAANAGYFSLNCLTPNECTYPYKVSAAQNGDLSGFAWNDVFGWVSFNCANDHDPATPGVQPFCAANGGYDYKVTVDWQSGEFSGWAWMPTFGWISFNCNNSGIGNTCGTSNYKVAVEKKVGRPMNAIQVRMTIDYNTLNPLAAYSETYEFAVALSQPASLTVTSCTIGGLACSGASGTTASNVQITGSNFKSGATVKLSRPGYTDIIGSGFTLSAGALVNGSFDLSGAAVGTWDVWVTNPDGQTGVLPDGFTVN